MKRIPVILLLVILAFTACKKQNQIDPTVTDKRSVSEYSPKEIMVKEEFFVRFVKDYISEDELFSEVSADLFNIQPAVKGKAIWEDRRTIVFKPETQWDYNSQYKAFVDTDMMFGTGKRSMITFMTRPVVGNLHTGQMELPSDIDTGPIVKGYINTNDFVPNELVENTLSVGQVGNNALSVEWNHNQLTNRHDYVIKGIKRFDDDSELKVTTTNQKPFTDFDSERVVVIPTKNKFSLLGGGLPEGGGNYIEVIFSDPIDNKQNLDGLVRLKDSNAELKYDISRNVLKIFPKPFPSGNTELIVSQSIKGKNGISLKEDHRIMINIIPEKPEVRFTSTGNILPNMGSSVIAFEAKQLHAVDVEIFKIYENNLQEFFQYSTITQQSNNRMVGKVVYEDKVILHELGAEAIDNGWERYALNLDYFTNADPAAIYEVRIGFKNTYAKYSCNNDFPEILNPPGPDVSMMDINYYQYEGYEWNHYEDPCYPAYYTSRNFIRKNVLVSNLGLVVKATKDKRINIYASDIRTATPLSGVNLNLYSQEKQLLGSISTDGNGMAEYDNSEKVFFVTGEYGREYAYLPTFFNRTLKTSHFEVGGVNYKNGMNGFLYGERGVWRPGDTIFLSLMLEDLENKLPEDHPVVLKMYNAKGELHDTQTKMDNVGGLYVFKVTSASSDPTGNWRAEAKVGNQVFRKSLKVETIKPNRLKINLDRANDSLYNVATEKIKVESKWLHGSPSAGLKVKVEANYVSVPPSFKEYDAFVFNDPARKINTSNQVVYDDNLNEDGIASFKYKFAGTERFPGNIKANLNTRVFEKSGNYSNYYSNNTIFPYDSYAGVKVPKSRWGRNYVSSKTGTDIGFVNVDKKGKPKANRKLKVGIYESYWSWWYNRSDRDIYKFNSDNHYGALDTFTVVTNSQGEAVYNSDFGDNYGNYLIRVCDVESGHCSGELFYTGRWGSSGNEESSMSTLNIKKNASDYKVGDEVVVNFPTSPGANVLVSVESSLGVIKSDWVASQGENTEYRFTATEDMVPNIYVNVMMLQTWERDNDLPLRMYGVIPITIKDPNTELKPVITSQNVFAPNSKVKVEVKEEDGKGMAYTIAMVDEGLLDLTNFKTPDPHKHFFAKQALNVRTWDLYDFVMNKHGGSIEKIISIGGDGENESAGSKANANRFKPVVHFAGPFYLEPGSTASHDIPIPNYMGSVKLMVVAKDGNKYGKGHKVVPVKKELMLLTTFPRVLTLGDQINIPVNTFWTENSKTEVSLNMITNDKVKPVRASTTTSFEKQGDKIAELVATTGEEEGVAEFRITGLAGGYSSFDEVEIDVRNPNPMESEVTDFALSAGETLSQVVNRFGAKGSQSATVEISRFPSLNMEDRLGYLIRYPHGCLEQTVSSAFPQLYLDELMNVSDLDKKRIARNISAAIKKLNKFNRTGRFNYWRGGSYYHGWSDVYAAHFLQTASEKGHFVGSNLLKSWQDNHYTIANNFEARKVSAYQLDIQAYRLYVLSVMGNPNTSAMNRLRNVEQLSDRATYLLAAAYGRIGQSSVGKELIAKAKGDFDKQEYDYHSFSSAIRDESIAAIALKEMDQMPNAVMMTKTIAEKLQKGNWYSTQSISFALLSIAQIVTGNTPEVMDYSISVNGAASHAVSSDRLIDAYDLSLEDEASFQLANNSNGLLYVSIINQGKLEPGNVKARKENLDLKIQYLNEDGGAIDHTNLKQGTDFLMKVTVSNPGSGYYNIEDLALTQIFPAGWEIRSGRLSNEQTNETYQYRDVRDDRVSTFFELYGRSSTTFTIKLNAAYVGDFYLPPTSCESMYNNKIYAQSASNRVKVLSK